jgi:hypothetical protein
VCAARSRHVRVGEFVDERDLGLPGEDGVEVHLLQTAAPVLDHPAGDDLQAVEQVLSEPPPMGLEEPDDHIGAPLSAPLALAQHRVRLADTRGRAQVNTEMTGRFDHVRTRLFGGSRFRRSRLAHAFVAALSAGVRDVLGDLRGSPLHGVVSTV